MCKGCTIIYDNGATTTYYQNCKICRKRIVYKHFNIRQPSPTGKKKRYDLTTGKFHLFNEPQKKLIGTPRGFESIRNQIFISSDKTTKDQPIVVREINRNQLPPPQPTTKPKPLPPNFNYPKNPILLDRKSVV